MDSNSRQISARYLTVGHVLADAPKDEARVVRVTNYWGEVRIWLGPVEERPADRIFNHGDPVLVLDDLVLDT